MIQADKLSIRRGESLLFNQATFQIHAGQKVGLSGANGSGKSSLFAAIKNELVIDNGGITLPTDWVIAHVAQEAPADDKSALDHVLDGDQQWRQLQALVEDTEHEDFLRHQSRFEEIDGYTAPARAARLLHGLGFKADTHSKPAGSFSGGWRVRLNVAKALMCRSDLLLLDEPTNHLDLDAVLWLEKWLRSYPGTLIVIAHDRDFLDQLTSHTLFIENQRLHLYKGNYSAFEKIRAEQLARQKSGFAKQQREIEHMQDFVRRFRAKATKAKQAQSRLRALEKMERIAPAHVDSPFHFTIPQPEKQPSPLLSVHQASLGYKDKVVLSDIEMAMSPGDRIGLIGSNGAGKSTFIKMLAGELPLMSGNLHQSKELKVGYFAQHQIEQLQMQHSPLEHLQLLNKQFNNDASTENQLRRYLGSFGFSAGKASRAVKHFSGGEKSRLALACLCFQRPNLLLLDEPTNHLDLEMRQALAVALQNFDGAVVLVSHDRHLLKVNSDQLILVADGHAQAFTGSVDDYPKWLAEHRRSVNAESAEQKSEQHNAHSKKQRKRNEAEKRQQLQPLSSRVKRCERLLEKLSQQKTEIETSLANVELYNEENKDQLKQLLSDQAYLQKELIDAEADWLQATEVYELALEVD